MAFLRDAGRNCCIHLMSLKVLLTVSFIALMVVAGFLGFYLTYIQSQQSLRDIAEVDMQEAAHSVMNVIVAKFEIGHMLNFAESMSFRQAGRRMDNFVNAMKYWWPLTVPHVLGVADSYYASTLIWPGLPGHGRLVSFGPFAQFCSLNATVCNDTVNFPGSNCSIMGTEFYNFNTTTYMPIFDKLVSFDPKGDAMTNAAMQSGSYSRGLSSNFRSSASNLFNPGYSEVYISPQRVIMVAVTVCLLGDRGECVGQLSKVMLLKFLGEFLLNLVTQSSLLSKGG
eukprot:RCo025469